MKICFHFLFSQKQGTDNFSRLPAFIQLITPATIEGDRNFEVCSQRITVENYYARKSELFLQFLPILLIRSQTLENFETIG